MFQSQFRPEGGPLPKLIGPFARFYEAVLSRSPGSRAKCMDIHAAYASWAERLMEPPMSARAMALCMETIGHPRIHSNGRWFLNVQFAARLDGAADLSAITRLRREPTTIGARNGIAQVDRAIELMLQVRQDLERGALFQTKL
jgi:hypothetical protein